MLQQTEAESVFLPRLSELAEQLTVTVFVGIPQINLFNKFAPNGFGSKQTKKKNSESCHKLLQTVWSLK